MTRLASALILAAIISGCSSDIETRDDSRLGSTSGVEIHPSSDRLPQPDINTFRGSMADACPLPESFGPMWHLVSYTDNEWMAHAAMMPALHVGDDRRARDASVDVYRVYYWTGYFGWPIYG